MKEQAITLVNNEFKKEKFQQSLRFLWRECFEDPLNYEKFYFDIVYSRNCVYMFSDKGMLHLNPYLCCVKGREYTLPYIVGVATDKKYRRQGVMRKLIQTTISDLYKEKVPFTYLMPADELYYLPFDFVPVTEPKEYELSTHLEYYSEHLHYMTYSEVLQLPTQEQKDIFATINDWLENRYDVYTIHNEEYFKLLYEEKSCQNGDVIFCFQNQGNVDEFCGMFAYALNHNMCCVEQIIMNSYQNNISFLSQYFKQYEIIKVSEQYPYMMRIVHLDSFLELFSEQVLFFLQEKKGFQIIDPILKENNQNYKIEDGKIIICTKEDVPKEKCMLLTISQLIEGVINNTNGVHFAEIV